VAGRVGVGDVIVVVVLTDGARSDGAVHIVPGARRSVAHRQARLVYGRPLAGVVRLTRRPVAESNGRVAVASGRRRRSPDERADAGRLDAVTGQPEVLAAAHICSAQHDA